MQQHPPRPPAPTPTSSSRKYTYRKSEPAVPTVRRWVVYNTRYGELGRDLANYSSPPASILRVRFKITRFAGQQINVLSPRAYEIVTRNDEQEIRFLPAREEIYTKRNSTRQKLSALRTTRFADLTSDVYFGLARRDPEFKKGPSGRGSNASSLDDDPALNIPSNADPRNAGGSRTPGSTSTDRHRLSNSGHSGSVSIWKPSQDRDRQSETDFSPGRRSEGVYLQTEVSVQRQKIRDLDPPVAPYHAHVGQRSDKLAAVETLEDSKPEHRINSSLALISPFQSILVEEEDSEESDSVVCSEAYSDTDSTDYGAPYTRMALSDESDVYF